MFRSTICLSILALVFLHSCSAFTTKSPPKKIEKHLGEPLTPNDPEFLKYLNSIADLFQKKLNLKEKPTINGFKKGVKVSLITHETYHLAGITVCAKEKAYKCNAMVIKLRRGDSHIGYLQCV